MDNKKRPGYIGPGKPTSPFLDSDILEAIRKARKEEARIIEELSKAQTNTKAKKLFERLEESMEIIAKLIGNLRETMRDMV